MGVMVRGVGGVGARDPLREVLEEGGRQGDKSVVTQTHILPQEVTRLAIS